MTGRSGMKFAALPQSRWLAYAAAAVATASGGVVTTEAEIHYSGKVNLRIDGSHFSWVRYLPRIQGIRDPGRAGAVLFLAGPAIFLRGNP